MRRFTPRSIRSIPCFVNTASRDRRPMPYYIGFARSANVCFCNRLRRDPSAPLPSIHQNQVIVITSVPLLTPTTQLPQSTPGSFLFLHNHRTTIAAYITSRPPPLTFLSPPVDGTKVGGLVGARHLQNSIIVNEISVFSICDWLYTDIPMQRILALWLLP